MKNLNPKNLSDWVLDALVNDEYSEDEEMVRYFMQEGNVNEEQARAWVAERAYYVGIDYLRDCLANAEEYRAKREAKREREECALAMLVAKG
jgi:N-acyl-D-aspartate/D-glutamate deacylase